MRIIIRIKSASSKKNKALESGEVYLNRKKVSDIKNDGKFQLDKLKSGTYKVEIKSKSVHFEPKTVRIDMSTVDTAATDLIRFRAKSFDVCGRVKINSPTLSSSSAQIVKSMQIKVYTDQSAAATPKSVVTLNEDHTFCVELVPGAYSIKAELSKSLAHILRLVPLERKITVIDSRLDGVDFEQLEARLDGQIRLVAGKAVNVPSDFKVVLKSVEANSDWTKEIPVRGYLFRKDQYFFLLRFKIKTNTRRIEDYFNRKYDSCKY